MIRTYLLLFYEFFKTGLFAVGGGLATLPFLYELADKYPWFDKKMLADMLAVSESTPGPIGINMATYAGFEAGGLPGGVLATFALVLPSVIVIILVAKVLDKFHENRLVKGGFDGLRPAVVGLIAAAGYQVFEVSLTGIRNVLIFFVLFFLVEKYHRHPILYILGGAVLGILLKV